MAKKKKAVPNTAPTDPLSLFALLLSARKAKDRSLESIVRGWLGKIGIRVVFDDALDMPLNDKGGVL